METLNKRPDGKYLLINKRTHLEAIGFKLKNRWSINGKVGMNNRVIEIKYDVIKEIK